MTHRRTRRRTCGSCGRASRRSFGRTLLRTFSLASFAALIIAGTMLPEAANAGPIDVVNSLRLDGCDRRVTTGSAVRYEPALDEVAAELARDGKLENAIDRIGFPAANATSFHVRGSSADTEIRGILERRFCNALLDARYEEAGFHQDGAETWIVLAARVQSAPALEPIGTARRVLELVNAARAEERRCGRQRFSSTHAVGTSPSLEEAARNHARDMADRGVVTHDGSDGSNVADRASRAGYTWRAIGENVAGGQRDAAAVVRAWLDSPGHCATLMSPDYVDMGVGYMIAPGKNPDIYWVQVFAAPRASGP